MNAFLQPLKQPLPSLNMTMMSSMTENDESDEDIGRPKVGLGIYIYSCHAGELFGFVPVARDEQAFSC